MSSLTEKRFHSSHHRRFSVKKSVLKNFAIFTKKHLYWRLFLLEALSRRRLQHGLQLVQDSNFFLRNSLNSKNTSILKNIANVCFWYFKRSYWTPPQVFCILVNIYEFSNCFTLGSISQYGNTSWAIILH